MLARKTSLGATKKNQFSFFSKTPLFLLLVWRFFKPILVPCISMKFIKRNQLLARKTTWTRQKKLSLAESNYPLFLKPFVAFNSCSSEWKKNIHLVGWSNSSRTIRFWLAKRYEKRAFQIIKYLIPLFANSFVSVFISWFFF